MVSYGLMVLRYFISGRSPPLPDGAGQVPELVLLRLFRVFILPVPHFRWLCVVASPGLAAHPPYPSHRLDLSFFFCVYV